MPPASDPAFRTFTLAMEANPFAALQTGVRFEDVGNGRRGTVLFLSDTPGTVPLVRTTTRYQFAAQPFTPLHAQLAQQIQQAATLPLGFNNALIETYTNAYTTMGSHSDQALDLADDSHIALFSCYEHPERATPPRKLVVEEKGTGTRHVFPLVPNSVVVFSVATNRHFKHKIVLDAPAPANHWLGLTFRTSKTLVNYRDGAPFFADGTPLTLARADESKAFYALRGRENHETDFAYPRLTYTISASDLLRPDTNET